METIDAYPLEPATNKAQCFACDTWYCSRADERIARTTKNFMMK